MEGRDETRQPVPERRSPAARCSWPTGLSVLTIILATELGFLQRILGTVSLSMDQWFICIGVSLSLIVVEEVRKLLKLRTSEEPAAAGVAVTASA